MTEHQIEVKEEPTGCGYAAHVDTVIACSCGWKDRLKHCEMHSATTEKAILYHRVGSLEKELGMKVQVTHKRR